MPELGRPLKFHDGRDRRPRPILQHCNDLRVLGASADFGERARLLLITACLICRALEPSARPMGYTIRSRAMARHITKSRLARAAAGGLTAVLLFVFFTVAHHFAAS